MTPIQIDRAVEEHISAIWPSRKTLSKQWTRGRIAAEMPQFRVLEVYPSAQDGGFAYSSVGAWPVDAESGGAHEFLMLSPEQSDSHVETLAMIASAHNDVRYRMREDAIIDIGRPWLPGSLCDHLLVTLPYFLDEGQDRFRVAERLEISYLWLVPVTPAEAEFGRQHGGHVLFHEFADADVDLLEIRRQSFK